VYLIDSIPVYPLSYVDIELECLCFLQENYPENLEKTIILDVLSLEDCLFGYKLEIDDDLEGTNIEGYTDFIKKTIFIPLKTYDALIRGYNNNRERFTTTHEGGHVILHRKIFENPSIVAARSIAITLIKPFEKPEWQANAASAALLMPLPTFYKESQDLQRKGIPYYSKINALALKFQVSTETTEIRLQTLQNKGVKKLISRLGL
jgi:hypothetical protein